MNAIAPPNVQKAAEVLRGLPRARAPMPHRIRFLRTFIEGCLGWRPEAVDVLPGHGIVLARDVGAVAYFALDQLPPNKVAPEKIREDLRVSWNLGSPLCVVTNAVAGRGYETTTPPEKLPSEWVLEYDLGELKSKLADEAGFSRAFGEQLSLLQPQALERNEREWRQLLSRLRSRRSLTQRMVEDMRACRDAMAEDIGANAGARQPTNEHVMAAETWLHRMIFVLALTHRKLVPELTHRLGAARGAPKLARVFRESLPSVRRQVDTSILAEQAADEAVVSNDVLGACLERLQYPYRFDVIPPALFGKAYELLLDTDLAGVGWYSPSGNRRRQGGIYYTPPSVARFLADSVLGHFPSGDDVDDVPTVIDPFCGSGEILSPLVQRLMARVDPEGNAMDRRNWVLRHRVFAGDIDPRALAFGQLNAYLTALHGVRQPPAEPLADLYGANFRVTDSFEIQVRDTEGDCSWPLPRGEGAHGAADIVVTNPPFGLSLNAEQRTRAHELYGRAAAPHETFVLACHAAHRHLREGGVLGTILPDSFTYAGKHSHFREWLLESFNVSDLVTLGASVFDNTTVNAMVMVAKKRVRRAADDHAVRVHVALPDGSIPAGTEPHLLSQRRFERAPEHVFNIYASDRAEALTDSMAKSSIGRLREFASIKAGLKAQKDRWTRHPSPGDRPLIRGRHVQPYELLWDGLYVRYQQLQDDPRANERPRTPGLFEVPAKIVLRQVFSGRIHACMDTERRFVDQSAYVLSPKQRGASLDPYFLLGVLCSTAAAMWCYARTAGARGPRAVFPRILANQIGDIPIPRRCHSEIAHLVRQRIGLSDADLFVDPGLDVRIREAEAEIDRKVFEAYCVPQSQRASLGQLLRNWHRP